MVQLTKKQTDLANEIIEKNEFISTIKVGMEVYPNYYYTDSVKKYVCIKGGFPPELAEGEYFTEI
nr:MAG TPA: hypothetical protein [Caudoviricetes sp.]